MSAEQAAKLSVLFDVGGIIGGVLIGWFSDSQVSFISVHSTIRNKNLHIMLKLIINFHMSFSRHWTPFKYVYCIVLSKSLCQTPKTIEWRQMQNKRFL